MRFFTSALNPLIHNPVVLDAEMANIRSFVKAERIQKEHTFQMRIQYGWPAESDVEAIVDSSSTQRRLSGTSATHHAKKPQGRLQDLHFWCLANSVEP